MKILVTGSKGFIGKHLLKFLQHKGVKTISYDLQDGQNLLDEKCLTKEMRKADLVIHLAAYGDVYQAAQDPVGAVTAGVTATASLVKVANKCDIKKIIYASTWEVYGEPQYQPIDEMHPCLPDHPYSISKYGGELMVRSKLNKVPWIILRLGSAYGPHMRPHAVIPLFIRKALKGEEIVLQGGGGQIRQFTHVDDINEAFYKAATSHIKNEILNIAADEIETIKGIATSIVKIIPTKIIMGDQRSGDVSPSVITNKKALKILKWKPQTPFERSLVKLIQEASTS